MIELRNIGFQYDGSKTESLNNVSLSVKAGECVVLTGASGCGKTSLTRVINGLIPHFYEGNLTGRAEIFGVEIKDEEPHQLAPIVGSVFQNPRTQFFTTDTDSEITFGMENCGVPYDEMHSRYDDTLRQLKLEKLSHRDIFALSGGEKQQIAFGSVYALHPLVYVLDEPSANLYYMAIERLKELLMFLKTQGKTILVAEHRLYYLQEIADRIVVMENGSISHIYQTYELAREPTATLNELGLRAFYHEEVNISKTPAPSEPVLEVKHLAVAYKKGCPVFSNVNITVGKGDIVGITGPNGQGKTTLGHTICGIRKETNGEICFYGTPVKQKKRRKHAYIVMQDPNYQLFSDSVEDEFKLSLSGIPPRDDERDEILEALNLIDLKLRHPLSLSGGQKQRLSIALAALNPAEVLIFDEPTSGLDYQNMCKVADMLKMLSQRDKAILVISHDNEFLSTVCNRIITLGNMNNQTTIRKEKKYETEQIINGQKA